MNMKKLATLVSAVALSATVSANAMAKRHHRAGGFHA
ncbi:D-ribose transporter subunit RbsB [Escherichia fergusonii]|nr:D-ribose transporter subunit RbsB [Escherichia fergusonii]